MLGGSSPELVIAVGQSASPILEGSYIASGGTRLSQAVIMVEGSIVTRAK